MGSFTADAVVTAGQIVQTHYRDRDHQGTETDVDVLIDADFSTYNAGDTLASVLADLWARTQ